MSRRCSARVLFVVAAALAAACGPSDETSPGTGGDGGSGGTGGIAGSAGSGGSGGIGGTGGTGGAVDLCAGVDCSDANDCTIDPSCNPANGACEGGGYEPLDAPCAGGTDFCDGAGRCVQCNRDAQCPDDGNECTWAFCDSHSCIDLPAGGACSYMGGPGVCENGTCIDASLCAPYPCENRGACVIDECDPDNGTCSYTNREINTPCLSAGGRYCDGDGRCVACNEDPQCDDENECTTNTCITGIVPQCLTLIAENGSNCEGFATACIDGQCEDDTLSRQIFSGMGGTLAGGIWNWWPARDWLLYEFYPYGLAGFYLDFTPGGVDHELEQMAAGFILDEYLPNIPGMETAGYALYQDKNGDDPYTWQIDAQKLPVGSTQHRESGCLSYSAFFNRQIGTVPDGYWPVLLGFNLDREDDYDLEQLRIRLYRSAGNALYLDMYFTRDGAGVPTCYDVRYALVPTHRVATRDAISGTSNGGDDMELISAQRPVLEGLNIEFSNGGHHVDEVGVRLEPGLVTVWLNDQNDDDPFSWRVWWADLR